MHDPHQPDDPTGGNATHTVTGAAPDARPPSPTAADQGSDPPDTQHPTRNTPPSPPARNRALRGAPPEEWPGLDWGDQGQQRLDKLRQWRAGGVDPYPPRFARTATAAEAIAAYEAWEAAHPDEAA